jgi:hypothetical protein
MSLDLSHSDTHQLSNKDLEENSFGDDEHCKHSSAKSNEEKDFHMDHGKAAGSLPTEIAKTMHSIPTKGHP